MERKRNDGREIKTTARVFDIIELLMNNDGLRLSDVAQELDMSKSNTHRHLSTLKSVGYVVQEQDTYHPGMKFLNIGEHVRTRKEIYRIIQPKIRQLAEETDERAEFMTEEHGRAIFVHREVGANAVDINTRVGKSLPIYATAAGKAILSEYPRERVEEIVAAQGLEQHTENTTTDVDELTAELERIRDRGIAYNDQEVIQGIRSVGIAIGRQRDEVYGALSITGPTSRLQGDFWREELRDFLQGAAHEIEFNLTY